MLRFIWVIVSCLFLIMYYVPKMSYYARHPEKYGEDICYQMAQVMCNHVRRRAFIKTVATGMENLTFMNRKLKLAPRPRPLFSWPLLSRRMSQWWMSISIRIGMRRPCATACANTSRSAARSDRAPEEKRPLFGRMTDFVRLSETIFATVRKCYTLSAEKHTTR